MKDQALRFALIVNAGLAVALGVSWVQQAREGRFWQSDFSMFYTGGRIVLEGHGGQLYDLDVQTAYQAEVMPERGDAGGLLVFNYPPHVGLMAALLALMSRDVAFFVWTAIQVGVFGVQCSVFSKRGESTPWMEKALVFTAILAFPGLFVNFQMGQVSLVVTIAILGTIRACEEDRPWWAAGWLVVASIKPQLALPAVVAILFVRRGAVVGRGALLFVPVVLLTLVLVGPWCWVEWIDIVRLTAGQVGDYGVFPEAMFNLRGRLFSLLGVERLALVNGTSLGLLLGVLGLIAWMAWRAAREDTVGFRLRLALSLQLGLLATPHLNPTDTLVFVVPSVLLWSAAPRWRPFIASVLLACPLILALDIYGSPRYGFGPNGVRPFVWLMIAMAGVIGWLYRLHSRHPTRGTP